MSERKLDILEKFQKRNTMSQLQYSKLTLQKNRTLSQLKDQETRKSSISASSMNNSLELNGHKAFVMYDKKIKMNKLVTINQEVLT